MKTLIYIIIIGLVVWGGWSLIGKDKTAPTSGGDMQNEEETPIATDLVADGSYTILPSDSKVEWTGSKTLIKDYYDTGSIMIKSGNLAVAENKITGGEITFDMASIAAVTTGKGDGQDKLSSHLKSADFFDVAKYPEAKFVIKGMFYAVDKWMLNGDLTMKASTSPISMPVNLVSIGGNLVLEGTASVDRTLWDVRYGSGKFFKELGDKVINDIFTLKFKVVANPQQ